MRSLAEPDGSVRPRDGRQIWQLSAQRPNGRISTMITTYCYLCVLFPAAEGQTVLVTR